MKKQIRVLGIDDAPFKFTDERTTVIGALVRAPGYLEAVLRTDVEVDGRDSTAKLIQLIKGSRYREQIKAVIIDGIALGGFNVVDLEELYRVLNIPVLTVTRKEPDFARIRRSLKTHFPDWRARYSLMRKKKLFAVKTHHNPIYVQHVGMELGEFEQLIRLTTIRGALPEPLRLAHIIAAGIVKGESCGRA